MTISPALTLEAFLYMERWLPPSQPWELTDLPGVPPNREDRRSKDPEDPDELAFGSGEQVLSSVGLMPGLCFLHSPISQDQRSTSFSSAVCLSSGCIVKLGSAAITLHSNG